MKMALKDRTASPSTMQSTRSVRRSHGGTTNTSTKGRGDSIYLATGPTVLVGLLSVAQGHNQGEGSSKTGLQPQPTALGHCSTLAMQSLWLQQQPLWQWQCTPVCRGRTRVTCMRGLRITSQTVLMTLRGLLKRMGRLHIIRGTLWNFKIWNPQRKTSIKLTRRKVKTFS